MVQKSKRSGCTYEVAGKRTTSFEVAARRAVALSAARHESVCIETIVMGSVVERIDVTAALSLDSALEEQTAMTIRCTERRFGLIGLFTAESIEDFLASIDDTIDRLAWRAAGLVRDHDEARRILIAGIRASLEVIAE